MKDSAFLFSGQGAQYIGMGKELYDQSSMVRDIFQQADDALGFSITKLCFEGEASELEKTVNAQPALLMVSYAMFQHCLQQYGFVPKYLAGQSIGELTALACTGAIEFSDAIKLVRERGRLMQEAVAPEVGAMAAVIGFEYNLVKELCKLNTNEKEIVVISNYNSKDRIVVSGNRAAVEKVSKQIQSLGAKVVPLHVSAPFHSPLMQTASEKFEIEMQKYQFHDFKYPVISNVTALPYDDKSIIIPNLKTQMVQQVQWNATMEYLSKQGVEVVIECGPRMTIRNLMKQNYPNIESYSYDDPKDIDYIASHYQKKEEVREDRKKLLTRCMAIAVCTRNYNDDNKEYQKGAVESYKKIERMVNEIESKKALPSIEQMTEGLELLRIIFQTKHTKGEEQRQRFEQIFEETGTRELFKDFIMPND